MRLPHNITDCFLHGPNSLLRSGICHLRCNFGAKRKLLSTSLLSHALFGQPLLPSFHHSNTGLRREPAAPSVLRNALPILDGAFLDLPKLNAPGQFVSNLLRKVKGEVAKVDLQGVLLKFCHARLPLNQGRTLLFFRLNYLL